MAIPSVYPLSSTATCTVDDCDRTPHAHGLCHRHYNAWRRTPNRPALPGEYRTKHPQACVIEGCERPYHAHGWCHMHWMRWRHTGDPLVVREHLFQPGNVPLNSTASDETRQKMSAAHRGRKLSPEWRAAISRGSKGKDKAPEHVAKFSGPNHYKWKGGHSRPLGGKAWRALRALVLERDAQTCQRCGAQRDLMVHHVIAWPEGPDAMDNLLTVCRSCHTKLHHQRRAALGEDSAGNLPKSDPIANKSERAYLAGRDSQRS
jgi:hypothetical protein